MRNYTSRCQEEMDIHREICQVNMSRHARDFDTEPWRAERQSRQQKTSEDSGERRPRIGGCARLREVG